MGSSHPSGDNRVDVSRVTGAQGHEICVECSDSLEPQSDVASGTKVQEVRGQIVGSGATVDQGCVDLRDRRVQPEVRQVQGRDGGDRGKPSHLAVLQRVQSRVVRRADDLGVIPVGRRPQSRRHVVTR